MHNLLIALLMLGCGMSAAPPAVNWQKLVAERVPAYGHRNWIVIADSAYPAQSKDGIETVVVDADQMTVLHGVLTILAHSKHVTPNAYIDQELQFLDEKDAFGIDGYRQQLTTALAGKPMQQLPHEQIIAKLDQVSQTFRVLILKTKMTLPYTSVFCNWTAPIGDRMRRNVCGSGWPRLKSQGRSILI